MGTHGQNSVREGGYGSPSSDLQSGGTKDVFVVWAVASSASPIDRWKRFRAAQTKGRGRVGRGIYCILNIHVEVVYISADIAP